MQNFDTVVRAGRLLTMSGEGNFELFDQMIGINGSKISYVGDWRNADTSANPWQAKKIIDAQKHIVLPGLINAHSHLPMSLFRGLADDLPFADWLNKYILPLEARIVSPELVRLGTELSLYEAIMSGTTCLYDMYYFEDEIADVCDSIGIRAVLGETVFDYAAPDNKNKDGNDYKILDRLVEKYKTHERITPFIAPHAPYTCSNETLKKVREYALQKNIQIGIHVSETRTEVENSLKEHSQTPLDRLHSLGVLEAPTIMAHCVHLTDSEIAIAAKTNASIVYNPESNMKLGSGAAPIKKFLDHHIAVGIGTDGPASNNDLNLFKEMDTGAKLQKLVEADNTAMNAKTTLRLATQLGAKALRIHKTSGMIKIGMNADIITVNTELPNMQPIHDSAAQLVYSTTGAEVDHVICHGKLLMQNRQCLTIDTASLFERIKNFRSQMNF
jgi:5-methylthioadenosine/S-adenosylhomocysteine deaminase